MYRRVRSWSPVWYHSFWHRPLQASARICIERILLRADRGTGELRSRHQVPWWASRSPWLCTSLRWRSSLWRINGSGCRRGSCCRRLMAYGRITSDLRSELWCQNPPALWFTLHCILRLLHYAASWCGYDTPFSKSPYYPEIESALPEIQRPDQAPFQNLPSLR